MGGRRGAGVLGTAASCLRKGKERDEARKKGLLAELVSFPRAGGHGERACSGVNR